MIKPLRVICLAGPTGVGKTAAALGLATALQGEIVNADSRQIYADFPLITAQPSAEEQSAFPHHLYGFLPCHQKLSAGRWVDMALASIEDIIKRGKTPILVGGTGLYFRALLEGIAAIPPIDPAISTAWIELCRAEGPQTLHAKLAHVDPEYAKRIHPHDKQRIVRALEVWQGTGKTFSWWHAHAAPTCRCQALRIGLDTTLAALEPRLAQRIDAMLEAGALQEAHEAYAQCAYAKAPGWSGIGCAELFQHIAGDIDLDTAKLLWLRNTRAYAKRQLTWFRADKSIHWVSPDAVDIFCALGKNFLDI